MRAGVEIVRGFPSPPEGCARTLRLFRPPAPAGGALSLLVMADGQNLFDACCEGAASWGVEAIVSALVRAGRIGPCLVVGVDHRGVDRLSDFAPWPDERLPVEPRGDRYVDFLAGHLLPWLRARHPIGPGAEAVALCGSSMGGLISLHAASRRPELFGRVAALSPTTMLGDFALHRAWTRHPGRFQRVYLDAGAREWLEVDGVGLDYADAATATATHLRELGYGPTELRLVLEPGGAHAESDWGRRLPAALTWLLA